MPENESGRVTMAVLGARLDNIDHKLNDLIGLFREHCREGEALGERVVRLEGRVTTWHAFQGVFTAIAASIAGYLGVRK